MGRETIITGSCFLNVGGDTLLKDDVAPGAVITEGASVTIRKSCFYNTGGIITDGVKPYETTITDTTFYNTSSGILVQEPYTIRRTNFIESNKSIFQGKAPAEGVVFLDEKSDAESWGEWSPDVFWSASALFEPVLKPDGWNTSAILSQESTPEDLSMSTVAETTTPASAVETTRTTKTTVPARSGTDTEVEDETTVSKSRTETAQATGPARSGQSRTEAASKAQVTTSTSTLSRTASSTTDTDTVDSETANEGDTSGSKETAQETSADGPGFSLLVAVIAIICAGVLFRRRA
jgi:PGF-CTERM protein